jgi:hypothetical protein
MHKKRKNIPLTIFTLPEAGEMNKAPINSYKKGKTK